MFTQQANQLVVQIWSGNSIISWKNLIWDSFACLYDLGSHCERAARHTVMRNMFRAWPTTRDAATNQWHGVLILTFTASSTPLAVHSQGEGMKFMRVSQICAACLDVARVVAHEAILQAKLNGKAFHYKSHRVKIVFPSKSKTRFDKSSHVSCLKSCTLYYYLCTLYYFPHFLAKLQIKTSVFSAQWPQNCVSLSLSLRIKLKFGLMFVYTQLKCEDGKAPSLRHGVKL